MYKISKFSNMLSPHGSMTFFNPMISFHIPASVLRSQKDLHVESVIIIWLCIIILIHWSQIYLKSKNIFMWRKIITCCNFHWQSFWTSVRWDGIECLWIFRWMSWNKVLKDIQYMVTLLVVNQNKNFLSCFSWRGMSIKKGSELLVLTHVINY